MRSRFTTICRQFTAVTAEAAADAELLSRFVKTRDDEAFAWIVKRHGPMVWSVCRNLLANATDADDAFQATFLALARGSKSVRKPEALGAWLHGVAVRVANKLKRSAARRTNREKKVAVPESISINSDSQWNELLAAVHEEVAKLPDGERTAFVVCCLEGVRQPDAIAQLGWKPGTLTGRLSKAKKRLLDRLTQRGLTPAAAIGAIGLGSTTGQAVVPAALVTSVTNFAANAGTVPATLIELTQGVTTMTISKVKIIAATVLVAGSLTMGGGAIWFTNADAQSAPIAPSTPSAPNAPSALKPVQPKAPLQPPSELKAPVPDSSSAPSQSSGNATPIMNNDLVPPVSKVARSASRVWEYRMLDMTSKNSHDVMTMLEKEGNDGWELATIDVIVTGGRTTERTAIFKRLKSSGETIVRNSNTSMPVGLFSQEPGAASSNRTAVGPTTTTAGLGAQANLPTVTAQIPGASTSIPSAGALPAPAVQNMRLHTIRLRWATATNTAAVLKELMAINEFGNSVTAVIVDLDSNSLIVKATDQGVVAVTDRAKALDDSAAAKLEEEAKRIPKDLRTKP